MPKSFHEITAELVSTIFSQTPLTADYLKNPEKVGDAIGVIYQRVYIGISTADEKLNSLYEEKA